MLWHWHHARAPPAAPARAAAARAAIEEATYYHSTRTVLNLEEPKHGTERGSTFQRKPACREDLQACRPVCSENGFTRGIYRLIRSFMLGGTL